MSNETIAWKICYTENGQYRTALSEHNSVGDYRAIDPMASSIALCAAHVGAEPLVARDLLRRAKTVLQLVDKDKGSTICTGGLISDISTYLAAPVAAQPDLTQQTLDDVMAGIQARDAEVEALQNQHATTLANIETFVACDASAISYLSLGEYRTALLKMLRQATATKEPGA